MSAAHWVKIHLALVYENGGSHPPLEGRLSHGQLMEARLIGGSATWKCTPGESCWTFEDRIVADVKELASSSFGGDVGGAE